MAQHAIGIIGQGRMGREHARAWSELGAGHPVRLRARCRTARSSTRQPPGSCTDLDVALSDPHVDIVSVCKRSPTITHIAIRSLRAGKNVPARETHRIDDGSRRGRSPRPRRPAAPCSWWRTSCASSPAIVPSSRTHQAGRFGTILSVRARRISAPGEQAPWMRDEAQSGGVLVDFAIHDFDQLNLHLGTPGGGERGARGRIRTV